jgi:hypothetical protein
MTYEVIKPFHDLQDGKSTKGGMIFHFYDVGDVYPRKGGPTPSSFRVDELSSSQNAQGTPLIRPISGESDAAPEEKPEEKPEE